MSERRQNEDSAWSFVDEEHRLSKERIETLYRQRRTEWLMQEYEGVCHVVPTSEPGHVLAWDCLCEPTEGDDPRIAVHKEMT